MTTKRESAPRRADIAAYGAVTAAYWAFMLSDGALRMLVLLHFHTLGFSPLTLAYLFVLYEIAGIVTNLGAGFIAARLGLRFTLFAGISGQVLALIALAQLDPNWAIGASVAYVMAVQGASGVAKDLAKMSAKSAVKLLAPQAGATLFRWVALLTGSKNAVKGLGFLIGAALLSAAGFQGALLSMATALALVLGTVATLMPAGLSARRKGTKFSQVFSTSHNVNWLSLARVFLFGARDIWFVVGVPIYFQSVLSDGSSDGNRTAFFLVGGFMASWVIFYGMVQAAAPNLLGATHRSTASLMAGAKTWAIALCALLAALTLGIYVIPASDSPAPALFSTLGRTELLITGLMLFAAVFALNSALHSYLILAFSKNERVTMDVGFYYMANAAGRLLGTLLSGLSFSMGGLTLCLATATAFTAISAWAAGKLRP